MYRGEYLRHCVCGVVKCVLMVCTVCSYMIEVFVYMSVAQAVRLCCDGCVHIVMVYSILSVV